MKKLFTLILAAFTSIGLWAANETIGFTTATCAKNASTGGERTMSNVTNLTVAHELVSGTADALSEYNKADKGGIKYNSDTEVYTRGGYKWNKNTGTSLGTTNNTVGFSVTVADGYLFTIDSISFGIGASANMIYQIIIYQGTDTLYKSAETTLSRGSSNYDLHPRGLSAQPKLQDLKGTFYVRVRLAFNGTGKYLFVPMFQVIGDLHEDCANSESTIKADTTLYAGASYNIGFNSINTNGCTVDVKKNGAAAVDDVDYTKTNINNYTFLKAGEYVITISQAADGTHCAVEESVTVTVNEATPVEAVTIGDAAHSARIGGSVELSATAANASEYQWFLNDEAIEGAETDSYTFNATAAGSYSFVCKARNDFNSGTWVASAAHVITVAVGTDAKLSALSVAGKTLTPAFNAATLEYAIGEIGVYETPNVTATAADAPYAEVAVVDNKTGVITVSVTAEDNTTKQDYVINYTRKAATELATISAATTWDFTKTGSSEIRLTDSSNPRKTDEFNYADLLTNPDASFNAAALAGVQEYVVRDNKFAQGTSFKFKTSVPGVVQITYSNTGNNGTRFVTVNGSQIAGDTGSSNTKDEDKVSPSVRVPAGEVSTGCTGMLRVYSIVFTPITMYAVSFAANGGTGEMEAEQYAEGDIVTLPECSFTAPDGKEFDAWTSEDVTISDNKFTMPANAVTITASWKDHATHSDATLKALSVAGCTLAPAFDAATLAYTTTLPFYASMPVVGDVTATKNDEFAQDPVVSIEGNVISILVEAENGDKKTYTVTVTITETPEASTSVNIEQNVLDNSKKWGVADILAAANITVSGTNGLDSLNDDPSKSNRNYAFLGLKFNKAQDIIKIIVPAEKILNVKFGNIATAINVTVNGVAQTPIATKTDGYSTEWNLAASNAVREVIFSLGEAKKTVTLQQVMIGEGIKAIVLPWRIQFDSDGGSDVADVIVLNGEAANQPADPTKTGLYFAGWYNGENKYDWESEVTSNLTLKAHWSENPTAISNTSDAEKAQKRIENGQLVIEKNGKVFNAMGQTIR